MCGIIGLFNIKNEETMRSEALKMVRKIRHRGPDWSGSYSDDYCVLMHERLAIVDVEHGAQPLYDTKTNRVLAVNGEIYNHLEIRDKLQTTSHQLLDWQGRSDTETLLAAFVNWGIEKTLNACVGMFSIALWDRQENVLTLVRDRMGEKPLYYGWQGNTFMFASELKALKVHPDFKGEIDRQS